MVPRLPTTHRTVPSSSRLIAIYHFQHSLPARASSEEREGGCQKREELVGGGGGGCGAGNTKICERMLGEREEGERLLLAS